MPSSASAPHQADPAERQSMTLNNNNNTNNQNTNREDNSSDNDSNGSNDGFPKQSKLACPIDVSCLWKGPSWAVSAWVHSAADMLGFTGGGEHDSHQNSNHTSGRRPRYVPLTTSTDSIDGTGALGHHQTSQEEDDDDDNAVIPHNNKNNNKKDGQNKNKDDSSIGSIKFPGQSLLTGVSEATSAFLGTFSNPVSTSGEFDVWQKYIRDLSNFSAVDVDVNIIASSTDHSNPCPYLHLTIRGPIIPTLGRCRRTLENSAFISPTTDDEWQEANPVAIMEVVEAFLLSVVAPESVEDDDAIETIVEAGTHILAHPALELQEFLKTVAEFVQEKCMGVKLIIRDIDFTAEFESARRQHAERFLVLDDSSTSGASSYYPMSFKSSSSTASLASSSSSRNNNNAHNSSSGTVIAREQRTGGVSSLMGNVLGAAKATFMSDGVDNGSCPEMAVKTFEADYTMLDIVRASRNMIRRIIQNISSLKSVELRGCLVRDTDLDANGIFAGRTASFNVLHEKRNVNDEDGDQDEVDSNNEDEDNDAEENNNARGSAPLNHQRGHSRTRSATGTSSSSNGEETRCFPYRSGFVRSEIRRVSGPSRLIIEHCGLTDAHISSLIRLIRVDTEKCRRNTTSAADGHGKKILLTTPFLSSISSLRLSGQFYPMTLTGLFSCMQDCYDDLKLVWAKKKEKEEKDSSSSSSSLTPDDRAARVPFPLEEVEVPASAVHTVRGALESRGLGYKDISVRSTD